MSEDNLTDNQPDNQPTDNQPTPDNPPEKILGKFNTQEDLQKAYLELEKKLSQPKADPSNLAPKSDLPSDKPSDIIEKYTQKYIENDGLDEKDYAFLEKKGYSKKLIDGFIAGVQATGQQFANQVYDLVGGQDNYNAMLKWAESSDKISDQHIEAYTKAMNSGDISTATFYVKGLEALYSSNSGDTPPDKTITGSSSGSETSVYANESEKFKDMDDPRYESDPTYRDQVDNKILRTSRVRGV